MSDKSFNWKKAFTKNTVNIVKGLANPDAVATELYSMTILTDEMFETIKQIDELEQKTRKLLHTLNYRGKHCVAALHQAFLNTDNKRLAEIIAPYVIEIEKGENKTEPKSWPPNIIEEEVMLAEPLIKITDPKSPWFIHEYGKEYVYKIQGKCRGKVFIINNVHFGNTKENREASNKDATNLSKLFKDLHFDVIQKDDLTGNGMTSFLQSEAEQIEKEKCTECVILIVMSHGGGTRISGVDHVPVELKALIAFFSSDNCPSLHEKPRLVFVQACRTAEQLSIDKTVHPVKLGGEVEIECVVKIEKPILEAFWEKKREKSDPQRIREKAEKYSLRSTKSPVSLTIKKVEESDEGTYRCIVSYVDGKRIASNATVLKLKVKDDIETVTQQISQVTMGATGGRDETDSEPFQQQTEDDTSHKSTFLDHPLADFLVAYATPEGSKAWRHADVGSWFMNAIVWTFKYHAHEEELHHLLIRVNRLVAKGVAGSINMTVAEVRSNLRKKFYFFPGIHGDLPETF